MDGIFISYRRDDCSSHAWRLRDRLIELFDQSEVFMDRTAIRPGVDFGVRIEEALSSCQLFIALIGDDWLDIADADGRRRLDDPSDHVRSEIATALRRSDLVVMPVLVEGATMPRAEQLPDDLKSLTRLNAFPLPDDARWRSNVDDLIQSAESLLTSWSQESPDWTERAEHGSAGGAALARPDIDRAIEDFVERPKYIGYLLALVIAGLTAGLIIFTGPKIIGNDSPATSDRGSWTERLKRKATNSMRGLTLSVVGLKQKGSTTRVRLAARNNTDVTLSLPVFGNCVLTSTNGKTLEADPHDSRWAEKLPPGGDLHRGTIVFEGTLPDSATRASLSFGTIFAQGFSRPGNITVSGLTLRRH